MPSYATTLGTLFVGIIFNTFLYGLVTYQFAMYYRTRFNDRPGTKYTVLFLFVLDTFHSASVVYLAWYFMVANYNNPAVLEVAPWPHIFTPFINSLTAVVIQIYLGFRIWCLTGSKNLYGVVIILAIPSFILGTCCSVKAWGIKVLSEIPRITPLVISWLSMQVIADMFITVTLTIIFIRWRSGLHQTDSILNHLIRGAIQTGLFAGAFALADLITFIVLPDTNLYGMFAIPIGRIYTNTLLDTLLARSRHKTGVVGTYSAEGSGPIEWQAADFRHASSTVQSGGFPLEAQTSVMERGDWPSGSSDGKAVPLAV